MTHRVEIFVTPDCPHATETERQVRDAVAHLLPECDVERVVVADTERARALAFPGSPTVRIDGEDLEGPGPRVPAIACRTYPGGGGVPPRWLVEARLLRALHPRHLLFLCVANSARSQMAEAIARSLAPADVRISSAGSEPTRVNPRAIAALAAIGIDASGQRSKSMDAVREAGGPPVDAVITLCAEEVCPAWLGEAARVHWPLPDPAAATGSDEQVGAAFRVVRDELYRRLTTLFEARARPADPLVASPPAGQ